MHYIRISGKNNLKCLFESSKQNKSFAFTKQWEKKLKNKINVFHLQIAFDFEVRHLLHVPISVLSLTLNSVTKLCNYSVRTFHKRQATHLLVIPPSPLTHSVSGSFLHCSLKTVAFYKLASTLPILVVLAPLLSKRGISVACFGLTFRINSGDVIAVAYCFSLLAITLFVLNTFKQVLCRDNLSMDCDQPCSLVHLVHQSCRGC